MDMIERQPDEGLLLIERMRDELALLRVYYDQEGWDKLWPRLTYLDIKNIILYAFLERRTIKMRARYRYRNDEFMKG